MEGGDPSGYPLPPYQGPLSTAGYAMMLGVMPDASHMKGVPRVEVYVMYHDFSSESVM